LHLWPIPRAVINDHHSQHTENRNRQRDHKRARECSLRLDSFLRLTHVHGCPGVSSLVKLNRGRGECSMERPPDSRNKPPGPAFPMQRPPPAVQNGASRG
jgi:hypothetical protein